MCQSDAMRSGSPQITAVLIGATVLAAVVAFLAIRSGGDGDEPVATPAPSVGAAVTVDPSELTTGGDGPLTGPVDGGFTRMELAPGETPPRPYGIVFADAETGASELWWVEDAEDSQPEYYLVDSTHRWLQFFDYQEPRILIADRETRETYEHNPDRWNLI